MFKSRFLLKALMVIGLPCAVSAQFVYWDPTDPDTSKVPATLSAMGLYKGSTIGTAKKVMVDNAYHFDVNSALWSDDSKKDRWILLKPGKKVGFIKDGDYYTYPDSAVFIKQFDIDTIIGNPSSRIHWETRVMINKKTLYDTTNGVKTYVDRWYGYSYKWNANQKDARRVFKNGEEDTIRVYPNGIGKASVWKKWVFPGKGSCDQCHTYAPYVNSEGKWTQTRPVLGFFTAQLNRMHPDSTNINQLEYFFSKGIMSGTKPTNWNDKSIPKWAAITDETASLDLRARSYIAANCSGCHGTRGVQAGLLEGVVLNYDYHAMKEQMDFVHHSTGPFGLSDPSVTPLYYPATDLVSNPNGDPEILILPALVVPGYPQKSTILFRQTSRNMDSGSFAPSGYQMPPLATYEVNVPATDLIRKWILEMKKVRAPNPILRHNNIHAKLKSPSIEGRILRLPLEWSDVSIVTLTSLNGKVFTLKPVETGVFAMPTSITKGVYIIRVGKLNFTKYLF